MQRREVPSFDGALACEVLDKARLGNRFSLCYHYVSVIKCHVHVACFEIEFVSIKRVASNQAVHQPVRAA
eukprot:766752-Lingulodinium_polyedra.AAC.1